MAAAAVAAAAQTVKLHAKQLPPVGLEQAEVLAGGLAEGLAEAAAVVEVPMERDFEYRIEPMLEASTH